MHDAIFERSFSKNEKRKLGVWAFLSCFLIGFTFCILLKAYYRGPLPFLDIQHSRNSAFKMLWVMGTSNDQQLRVENNTEKWDNRRQQARLTNSSEKSESYDREITVTSSTEKSDHHDEEAIRVTNSLQNSDDQEVTVTNSTEKLDNHEQEASVTNNTEKSDSHGKEARIMNSSEKSVQAIELKKIKPLLVPICNFSQSKSDFCEINDMDVRIHGNSSNIFIVSSSQLTKNISAEDGSWRIRPYARKGDLFAMGRVRELSLKPSAYSDGKEIPKCTKNHSVPGIVFSVGGYSGNSFHDFSDILIPLYITTRHLNGEVEFLVANASPWWLGKYRILLTALSKYDIIDIDRDQEIHCFRSMIAGLKAHSDFGFDSSSPGPDGIYSMPSFTRFIRNVYSLKRDTVITLKDGDNTKPRLLIMARKGTRAFVNLEELAAEARSLGYRVKVADASWNTEEVAQMVNSFDAMLAVHGAGLTNTLFLPQRAVVIQVVPLGLELVARYFYELPAKAMNLRYLEYKIAANESTLIDKYPIDHPVIRDPSIYGKQGWGVFKKIYLDAQNIRLDISKFRTTLLQALELLREQ
ncbi:hypothetical protein Ancab_036159 [Ancistrocladus abbreviatus]